MADLRNNKHLFFDFDDTLWDFQKNSAVVLAALFEEFELAGKLKTDFHNFQMQYRAVNLELWARYSKKQIDKQHMRNHRFHTVFNLFGYDNYSENLLVTQQYLHRTPQGTLLKEGCIDTLNYLKQNYHLHIITNGFKETQAVKIDGCNLRDYFTHIIVSEEHALIKPEEKIFRLAESLAGAGPEHCVMIGDSFESDVEGALNAGWDAVYFSELALPHYKGPHITQLTDLKKLF